MKNRCMLCGKLIEEDIVVTDPFDDDEDEDELMSRKKSMSFCVMCQAKLKHEADENQKNPKPL
ncbi:MAG: hypothetical protein PHO01_07765 [Desulfotomaculaceae bacterium]|nr:hypothetical protein [Desulfotomaculaceae bacterium]